MKTNAACMGALRDQARQKYIKITNTSEAKVHWFKMIKYVAWCLVSARPSEVRSMFFTHFSSWLNIKILPYHASESYMYWTWIWWASILRLQIKCKLQDKLCPEEQVCISVGVRKRPKRFFIYQKIFFPDVNGTCVESHQIFNNSFKFFSPIENLGMLIDKRIIGQNMWIFADFPLVIYYSTSNTASPGKKTDNERELFVVTNARRQKIWI